MTHHFRNTALFAVATTIGLVISGCGSTGSPAPAASTSATGTSAAASAGSPGSAPATTPAPTTPGAPALTTGLPAGYLPLYPFASLADVRAWQASYESGGHQPWHRSPNLTATAFAAFLGYTDVKGDQLGQRLGAQTTAVACDRVDPQPRTGIAGHRGLPGGTGSTLPAPRHQPAACSLSSAPKTRGALRTRRTAPSG